LIGFNGIVAASLRGLAALKFSVQERVAPGWGYVTSEARSIDVRSLRGLAWEEVKRVSP